MSSLTGQNGAGGAPGSGRPGRRAWLLLLVVTAAALAVDLLSKYLAFRFIAGRPVPVEYDVVMEIIRRDPSQLNQLIPRHDPITVIPRVLDLTLLLNPGAVFGIGPGQRLFFILFTGVALAFALLLFWRWTRARDRLAHVSIGLVIAGGLGNLYDRLVHGAVRDMLRPLPGVRFPFGWRLWGGSGEVWPWVSNVADALLLAGIAGLAVHLWRADRRSSRAAKNV